MLQATGNDGDLGVFTRVNYEKLLAEETVLILKPACPLTVVVRDTQGNALENVELSLLTWFDTHGLGGPMGRTDGNGHYNIRELYSGGDYRIWPSLAGHYFDRNDELCRFKPGTATWTGVLELTMQPATRSQKGRVVDEGTHPMADVAVETDFGPKAMTDSNGEFIIHNLPDGEVALMVRGRDRHGSARASAETPEVVIKVRIPRTASGMLFNHGL